MRKKPKNNHQSYHYDLDPHSLAIIGQARDAMQTGRSLETPPPLPTVTILTSKPFFTSTFSAPTPSEAIMIIARFEAMPKTEEKIVIIKDYDKPTLGFPFGGVENGESDSGIIDKDKPQACRREILEEIFGVPENEFSEDKAQELGIVITESDFIGKIQKAPDHTVYVYAPILPASCRPKLKHGKEQQAVLVVSASKIDQYIEEGIFLDTHAKGWKMFKQRFYYK